MPAAVVTIATSMITRRRRERAGGSTSGAGGIVWPYGGTEGDEPRGSNGGVVWLYGPVGVLYGTECEGLDGPVGGVVGVWERFAIGIEPELRGRSVAGPPTEVRIGSSVARRSAQLAM